MGVTRGIWLSAIIIAAVHDEHDLVVSMRLVMITVTMAAVTRQVTAHCALIVHRPVMSQLVR